MSGSAKERRKEIRENQAALTFAVRTERERCAAIADAFEKRSLDDGMIAHADAARRIAADIRGGAKV